MVCLDPCRIRSQPRQPSVKPAARKSDSHSLTPRLRGGVGIGGCMGRSVAKPGSIRILRRVSASPGFGCSSVPCSRRSTSASQRSEAGRLRMHRVLRTCPDSLQTTTSLLDSTKPKNHPVSNRASAMGSRFPACVSGWNHIFSPNSARALVAGLPLFLS